jgi:VWFA-related protein
MVRPSVLGAAIAVAAGSAILPATGQQRPTFRATSNTVVVEATVAERGGRLVPDLTQHDFEIFEDGDRRPITGFSREEVQISVAVLLDLSGSMRPIDDHPDGRDRFVRRMRAAAAALMAQMPAEDRASLGIFSDRIGATSIVDGDKRPLLTDVDKYLKREMGATPLWETLNSAIDRHAREPGRRVVLAFTDAAATDGRGTAGVRSMPVSPRAPLSSALSTVAAADVMMLAARLEFMAYWIGLEGMQTGIAMDQLIGATGGGQFILSERADLTLTFARVVEELRHVYVIAFTSGRAEPRRSVDLRVTRPNLRVHARRTSVGTRR